jgi:uncharacterized Zn finger protein
VQTDDGTKYLCTYCKVGEAIYQAAKAVNVLDECRPHEYQTGTKELIREQGIIYVVWKCCKCGQVEEQTIGEIPPPPKSWRVVD